MKLAPLAPGFDPYCAWFGGLKPDAAIFSAFWQHAFRGAGRQTGHAASRGGIPSVGKPGKFNGIASKSA